MTVDGRGGIQPHSAVQTMLPAAVFPRSGPTAKAAESLVMDKAKILAKACSYRSFLADIIVLGHRQESEFRKGVAATTGMVLVSGSCPCRSVSKLCQP
jgi:hypothetical protein